MEKNKKGGRSKGKKYNVLKRYDGQNRIKEGRQKKNKSIQQLQKNRMNNRKMWERKMTTNEVLFPFLQFLEKHHDKLHS